jgi:hypothetical protein
LGGLQAERPKSPWTPSYSVTTLPGSPRIPVQSEVEESQPPSPAPELVVDETPAVDISKVEEEIVLTAVPTEVANVEPPAVTESESGVEKEVVPEPSVELQVTELEPAPVRIR